MFNKLCLLFFMLIFLSISSMEVGKANTNEIFTMNHLEQLTLNGTPQWIYTTGTKPDNPVLLVLHGGPGFAMLPLFHEKVPELENHFTVVNWDQRGAGKSYTKTLSPQSMSMTQLVADAHELTQLLKARFKTNKIYLLGHSSGTMLGVLLAKQYPQDYHAYIGIGQVVNFAENELGSYDYALQRSISEKNAVAENELMTTGRPDHNGNYKSDNGYEVTTKWVEYFGGSLHKNTSLDDIYDTIFHSKIYLRDKKKILEGYNFSQKLFDDTLMRSFNLTEEVKSMKVPIYLLSGKYDYETPCDLVKKKFPYLKAKKKEYIEFSQSAHFPFYEEPEKFVEVMKNILLQMQK